MQIITKNLKDLRPYENNPRLNDSAVEAVANSIKEFGFKVPMIITKDGEIVAGMGKHRIEKLWFNFEYTPEVLI